MYSLFSRSASPASNAVKSPPLVGFYGSWLAMAGTVYIQWMCYKNTSGEQNITLIHGCSRDSDYDPELHESKSYLLWKLEWDYGWINYSQD